MISTCINAFSVFVAWHTFSIFINVLNTHTYGLHRMSCNEEKSIVFQSEFANTHMLFCISVLFIISEYCYQYSEAIFIAIS